MALTQTESAVQARGRADVIAVVFCLVGAGLAVYLTPAQPDDLPPERRPAAVSRPLPPAPPTPPSSVQQDAQPPRGDPVLRILLDGSDLMLRGCVSSRHTRCW